MATKKQETEVMVNGRALVDIPRIGAKCGEYITISAAEAKELEAVGDFDPKAKKPD